MLDTTWVAAGLAWVLWANNRAEATPYAPAYYDYEKDQYHPEQPSEPGDNRELTKAARIWGYGSMVFFGASAIYGAIVEGSCLSYRNRIAGESKVTPTTSARNGFPFAVQQFNFGMTLAQAGNACENSGRVFQVDGELARCVNAPGAIALSEMRLRYSLGTVSEITVIYRAPREGLNTQYRRLADSLRGYYGEPQVAVPNLSAGCAASLEQCLADGDHPGGPVWRWAVGSIEIAPVWRDEHPLIELHYTREE